MRKVLDNAILKAKFFGFRMKDVLVNNSGENYVDTAVKILIAVVLQLTTVTIYIVEDCRAFV